MFARHSIIDFSTFEFAPQFIIRYYLNGEKNYLGNSSLCHMRTRKKDRNWTAYVGETISIEMRLTFRMRDDDRKAYIYLVHSSLIMMEG